MSSRRIEHDHELRIRKLFSKSGLECMRTVSESSESFSTSGESSDHGADQDKEDVKEVTIEEETILETFEEHDEIPEIFPTPSLRHVLPEDIRKIEAFNRIHVLPEKFRTDIDPMAIPRIASTPPKVYIDILAGITGCTTYKRSLGEFWFLDTLANLLRRAQEDQMERPAQATLILWFCEWMKEMQHFDAADRQRMIRRFQDNIMSAARYVSEQHSLPTPNEAGVFYEEQEIISNPLSKEVNTQKAHSVAFEGAKFECSLIDLTHITHYIFDLFSTDYQYDLVRSVFTFTPEYTLIEPPYQIRQPKKMYSAKSKTKSEKSPKKEKLAKGKGKKEIENEDYLALLELQAQIEREQEEQANMEREEWLQRSQILPLSFAADEEFFNKYWPPPPPEPEPEPVVEVKGKGKGKGKK